MDTKGLRSAGGATVSSRGNLQETSNLGHPQTPLKGTVGRGCGGTERGSRVLIPYLLPSLLPRQTWLFLH